MSDQGVVLGWSWGRTLLFWGVTRRYLKTVVRSPTERSPVSVLRRGPSPIPSNLSASSLLCLQNYFESYLSIASTVPSVLCLVANFLLVNR